VNENGAVNLYYDNSNKLSTTNTGIDVTGTVTATAGAFESTGATEITLEDTDGGFAASKINVQNGGRDLKVTVPQDIIFNVGSSDAVTILNGGNVGIGTSSPSEKLTVQSSAASGADSTALRLSQNNFNVGGTTLIKFGTENTTWSKGAVGFERVSDYDTGALIFCTNDSSSTTDVSSSDERMRIDSSGHIGINVSSSLDQKLNMADTADVGIKMTKTGSITTTMRAVGGALAFGVDGGSGTTERMRIDSQGNLLVGTTTTNIATEGTVIYGTNNEGVMQLSSTAMTALYVNRSNNGELVQFRAANVPVGSIGTVTQSGATNLVLDSTSAVYFDTNARPKTDNTYDVGSGTYRFKDLHLSGTANVGSNLLVGTTSAPTGSTGGSAFIAESVGRKTLKIASTTTGGAGLAEFINPNGIVGSISTSGSATTYSTSSDQRLKENIVDAPSASNDIDAIQVRSFDWIADGSHQDYGMIAQELQAVAPEAVTGDADSDEMMGVDYSKLVPMLVKEIQSLRARVAQLEN
jgi:hypothetical protein